MGGRRALLSLAAAAALVPVGLSVLLAALATRPRLAAKAFGGRANPSRHPSDFGLSSTDVEYSPGCSGWWVPTPEAVGSVVIVHGFEASEDPRATDTAPRIELAALICEAGYNCLIISLGYSGGTRLHSGGALEAADIAAAVQWAATECDAPVAVVGFSAGGHAAVAATNQTQVFAVVTDSSFVDFREVVIQQGVSVLSIPSWFLTPVPAFMRLATGHAPVDLASWPIDRNTPMLHIHGDADRAINFSNLKRLAAITGGQTLAVHGAGHIGSFAVNRQLYSETVLTFLHRSGQRD